MKTAKANPNVIVELAKIAKRNELVMHIGNGYCTFGDTDREAEKYSKDFKVAYSRIENNCFVVKNYIFEFTMYNNAKDHYLDNIAGLINIRFCIDKDESFGEHMVIVSEVFDEALHEKVDIVDAFNMMKIEDCDPLHWDYDDIEKAIDKLTCCELILLVYKVVKEKYKNEKQ